MKDKKVFQMQNLDSKDYEKTEKGAKAAKAGIATIAASVLAAGGLALKKFGPRLLNNLGNILKR